MRSQLSFWIRIEAIQNLCSWHARFAFDYLAGFFVVAHIDSGKDGRGRDRATLSLKTPHRDTR